MKKSELAQKIERNKELLSRLTTKKINLEKQIEELNLKILNQENALLNIREEFKEVLEFKNQESKSQ